MSDMTVSMESKEFLTGGVYVNGMTFIVHKPVEDAYNAAIARAERAEAENAELRDALKTAYAEVVDAQGEWALVDEVYAPEWTWPLKRVMERLCNAMNSAKDGEKLGACNSAK